jgi:hypothetical protein
MLFSLAMSGTDNFIWRVYILYLRYVFSFSTVELFLFFSDRTYALYKLIIMCIDENRTLQAVLKHHLSSSDR